MGAAAAQKVRQPLLECCVSQQIDNVTLLS